MESLADVEKRVEVPLVRCEHPFPAPLTNERIGEILDDDDAAADNHVSVAVPDPTEGSPCSPDSSFGLPR